MQESQNVGVKTQLQLPSQSKLQQRECRRPIHLDRDFLED